MATIQKRGDSYRITVSSGYTVSGRQVRQSKTWAPPENLTSRQIEKELQRQAVLFEDECKKLIMGGSIKFEEFADQWFTEYAEPKLRIKTVERYRQLKIRAYTALGHLHMDKVTPRQIQAFITSLSAPGVNQRTKGALAPKTVKHYLSFVSSVFDYAVSMYVVKDNPCSNIALPSAPAAERECYTLEEAQKLLEHLEQEPLVYQVFFTLAIYGGFRRGELMGMEWKDADFDSGIISIRRTSLYAHEKGIFTDTTKTKTSQRSLKLPPEVIALLKRYKAAQTEERLGLGDRWVNSGRIFVGQYGAPMNPNTPFSWFWRFCERTGMRKVNIHSFRHLNATLLITSGIDAKTVSASLGHSQVSTTLNIYAHTFQETQAKAMDALASTIMKKKA